MDLQHLCEVLCIQPGASVAELKAAYRDLAQVWHPDRFVASSPLSTLATDKMQEINEAYKQLLALAEPTGYVPLPARPAPPLQPPPSSHPTPARPPRPIPLKPTQQPILPHFVASAPELIQERAIYRRVWLGILLSILIVSAVLGVGWFALRRLPTPEQPGLKPVYLTAGMYGLDVAKLRVQPCNPHDGTVSALLTAYHVEPNDSTLVFLSDATFTQIDREGRRRRGTWEVGSIGIELWFDLPDLSADKRPRRTPLELATDKKVVQKTARTEQKQVFTTTCFADGSFIEISSQGMARHGYFEKFGDHFDFTHPYYDAPNGKTTQPHLDHTTVSTEKQP